MTTAPDPIELVRQAADDSVARRRVALAVIATLGVLAVLNLAVLSAIASLVWSDHQDRLAEAKERKRREADGAQIIGDLYASINRTDAQLAELTGRPVPPTVVAPTTTAQSTRRTTAAPSRPATTTTRPSQPTSTTTTATTTPPPPAPSTTTTAPPRTTTTACPLAITGRCVP